MRCIRGKKSFAYYMVSKKNSLRNCLFQQNVLYSKKTFAKFIKIFVGKNLNKLSKCFFAGHIVHFVDKKNNFVDHFSCFINKNLNKS